MAYSVECLRDVNEVVVKVPLVIYEFYNYDSAVEYNVQQYSVLFRSSVHLAWVAGQVLVYDPTVPVLYEASFLWQGYH